MLKKIIEIKNVGRFQNSAGGGDTQFGKYTFIHGANGHGKTTICSILRSLKTGDPGYVLGRATLGALGPAEIELLTDTSFHWSPAGAARMHSLPFSTAFSFAKTSMPAMSWTSSRKCNLLRVIVGEAGVALAEQEAQLAAGGRAKTGESTAAEKAIKTHLPPAMKLEVFLALPQIDDLEQRIAEQEAKLRTVAEAAAIKARPGLATLSLPAIPDGLQAARRDHRGHFR